MADSPTNGASEMDAIEQLESDHQEVKALFDEYNELVDSDGSDGDKQAVAQEICAKLTAHALVEEELFYPAARDALDEPDLINEATVEHASAKDLIAQIEASDPSDEMFDAKVKVLGEYIEHHVREEEGEMFPKVRKTDMDLDDLGAEMFSRKEELLAELGATEAP